MTPCDSPCNSPSQNTGVHSCFLLQGIFPAQGLNPGLPHCRWIRYQLSHKRSPTIQEWVAYAFPSGSFWPRNWTEVSCTAGRLFTNWAIREVWLTSNFSKEFYFNTATDAWESIWYYPITLTWQPSLSLFTFMLWRRKWQPPPVFLPGESQGWGSLVGFRLWGCTESDTTEVT